MENNLLETKDYLQILQTHLGMSSFEIIKADISNLSDNIEGYGGDHFKLKIHFKNRNKQCSENYFIKTVTVKTKIQIDMLADINAYAKEIFLYDFLFREFEKLNLYSGFAPKCYLAKNNKTIVLEDLNIRNFQIHGRQNFYDVPHCEAALKALAHYHANSILYEENKSKELNRPYRLNEEYPEMYNEIFYKVGDKNGVGYKFIQSSIDCFETILDHIPESQEWRESFKNKIRNFDLADDFNKEFPCRKTNGHGDLWSNNMMFRYNDNIPIECCLIDFQILRYHHPAFDALLLVNSNTRRKFREENMDNLMKYYYECLKNILFKGGHDINQILPSNDFKLTTEWFEFLAKLQSVAGRTFTFLPAKFASDLVNMGGDNLEDIMFKNNRGPHVVKLLENDQFIREIFTEDLLDLKESLYKK